MITCWIWTSSPVFFFWFVFFYFSFFFFLFICTFYFLIFFHFFILFFSIFCFYLFCYSHFGFFFFLKFFCCFYFEVTMSNDFAAITAKCHIGNYILLNTIDTICQGEAGPAHSDWHRGGCENHE